MTIEEKVKKLNSICNEKILVWTKDKREDLEFCEFINEHYNMRYGLDSVKSSYYYVEEIEEDGEYLEGEIVVTFSNDCYSYQIIPYSEFFKDDKVEDIGKIIENWTLGELKKYCNSFNGSCKGCRLSLIIDDGTKSCFANESPCDFDFEELNNNLKKLSLTQSEIDILKAIKVLYGGDSKILYAELIDCFVDDDDTCQIPTFNIEADRLPSLSHDKEYDINELLKEV